MSCGAVGVGLLGCWGFVIFISVIRVLIVSVWEVLARSGFLQELEALECSGLLLDRLLRIGVRVG